MWFEILRGTHSHGDKLYAPLERDGSKLEGTVGNRIESDVDLEERFGGQKFKRLHDIESHDQYERMTIKRLRDLAEVHGIDLGDSKKKATIAAIVREAMETAGVQ